MKHLKRLKSMGVVAGILLIIGAVEFLVVNQLKRETRQIVRDTLPGLSYGGKISDETSENFVRTVLMISANTPEERAAYLQAIAEGSRSVDTCLREYQKAIYEPEDRRLYAALLDQRKKYVQVRRSVFELIDNGKQDEAMRVFKTALLPAYKEYIGACSSLFDYNMRQGDSRGNHILTACNTTQLLVIVIGIVIFLGGFLTPFIAIYFLREDNG